MTTFALLLTQSPFAGQAFQSCLRFANAAVQARHQVEHIFLYQDAVLAASVAIDLPSDEPNAAALLADFCQQQQIPLLFCSTAAEKRGVNLQPDQLGAGYQLAGLAEHAMRLSKCDKLVQF
ncbi:sulfurtransferase complex subunit TusD [Alkalimonas amylolytica]|uniref:tRNA 2-thiouridine synthesizing protein D n=1 Tax=Alkalimonas amylolytica TaxID=152573 RepID=A0A1H3ZS54_ALKAM|nr:sulfurtransferase complex subunit TusD [Alkalimonas amylolytica]SEA26550.1 tRNA 2-thiouridine synthesizing protein D [Alkalimonas amylolytica]